jgi:hypothetical protein
MIGHINLSDYFVLFMCSYSYFFITILAPHKLTRLPDPHYPRTYIFFTILCDINNNRK